MKFTSPLLLSSSVLLLSAVNAVPLQSRNSKRVTLVDASLVPEFGVTAGIKDPAGSASCVGINNILIPCTCPPPRDAFIASLSANVAAGHDVNNTGVAAPFPTDNSAASQIVRLQTSVTTLQNLFAAGVGCPASSTTFLSQIAALQKGGSAATTPAPAAAAPAPAATQAAAASSGSGLVDASLVPEFGVTAGIKDPAGSASCVGINNILIPCTCPPPRDAFIKSLSANVAAGHDVNNTGVAAPFPTDNSAASQIVRLQTSVTTLQNPFAAGVGCPASSTTFLSQIAALQNGGSGNAAAAAPAAAAPAPAATKAAAPSSSSTLVDASLVPEFGVTAGIKDPAGSASCVGINNILIPCTCPPSRDSFIASLSANVANGHDVNNPSVAAPFPTDSSAASQIVRLQTSVTSLQNLFGAGVGCPASSTTFLAQIAALQGKQ